MAVLGLILVTVYLASSVYLASNIDRLGALALEQQPTWLRIGNGFDQGFLDGYRASVSGELLAPFVAAGLTLWLVLRRSLIPAVVCCVFGLLALEGAVTKVGHTYDSVASAFGLVLTAACVGYLAGTIASAVVAAGRPPGFRRFW